MTNEEKIASANRLLTNIEYGEDKDGTVTSVISRRTVEISPNIRGIIFETVTINIEITVSKQLTAIPTEEETAVN